MIYGKSFEEKDKSKQEWLKNVKENGIKKFAWLPVTLTNGKKVWLEYYYCFYKIRQYYDRFEYIDMANPARYPKKEFRYLTQKEGKDALH